MKIGDLVAPAHPYIYHKKIFGVIVDIQGQLYHVKWINNPEGSSYGTVKRWQIDLVASLTNP
jgi:hypothetical protein